MVIFNLFFVVGIIFFFGYNVFFLFSDIFFGIFFDFVIKDFFVVFFIFESMRFLELGG